MITQIAHKAKESGHLDSIKGYHKDLIILQKRKGHHIYVQNQEKLLKINVAWEAGSQIKKSIQEIINIVKQKYPKVTAKIQQKKLPGEKFGEYSDFIDVFGGHGHVNLSAKQGQVLLIDTWSTTCQPCQDPMAHNQQMLQKNKQKWGQNVRIVGVSLDRKIQAIIQRVNKRGWKSIDHLGLGSWDKKHPFIKDFQIRGIPQVILIDKKGIINFAGHPTQIDLQKRINQLLYEKNQNQQIKGQQKVLKTQQVGEILKKFNDLQYFDKILGGAQYICLKLQADHNMVNQELFHNVSIQIHGTPRDKQLIDKFEKQFIDSKMFFTKKIIDEIDIPKPSQICSNENCKKQLKYPFYWCRWSEKQNDFRCRQCIQGKDTQTYFSYKNNSILLFQQKTKIPIKNLGQNIQPQDLQQIENPNQFLCNACKQCPQQIGIVRYICLQCKSQPNYDMERVDICQFCLYEYIQGKENIVKNLDVKGHDKSHGLLRILFNVYGYWKY